MRLDRQSGFSLMELIIVILILSLALLPLITEMVQTTVHGADGQIVSAAAFLAREKLQVVEADASNPAVAYSGITQARYPDEGTLRDFPGYTRTVRVSPDSTFSGHAYKVVRVTVTAPTGLAAALTTWVVQ